MAARKKAGKPKRAAAKRSRAKRARAKRAPAKREKLPEFTFTRLIDAPRELVWDAWTKAEHIKAWIAPARFTSPDASIDARAGGGVRIVMRSPEGQDFLSTGVVRAVKRPERLEFESSLDGSDGKPMLKDMTTVTLADVKGKTKLTVHARVTLLTDEGKGAAGGMEEGWNQSLDQLVRHVGTLRP